MVFLREDGAASSTSVCLLDICELCSAEIRIVVKFKVKITNDKKQNLNDML
jgi:hypothetical protein